MRVHNTIFFIIMRARAARTFRYCTCTTTIKSRTILKKLLYDYDKYVALKRAVFVLFSRMKRNETKDCEVVSSSRRTYTSHSRTHALAQRLVGGCGGG